MNEALTVQAKCPYFKAHTRRSITCEWFRGRLIIQHFDDEARMREYMGARCCTMEYGRCPLAAVLNAAWKAPPKVERRVKARKLDARQVTIWEVT